MGRRKDKNHKKFREKGDTKTQETTKAKISGAAKRGKIYETKSQVLLAAPMGANSRPHPEGPGGTNKEVQPTGRQKTGGNAC